MLREDDKKLVKNTLVESLPGIWMMIFVLGAAWIFKPTTFFGFIIIFTLVVSGLELKRYVVHNDWSTKRWAKNLASTLGFVICIVAITKWLGKWGLLGFIVLILLLSGWILWKQRRSYMSWVHHIERRFLYNGKIAEERRVKK